MLHCLILFVLVSSIEHLRYIYPNQTTIVFLLTQSQSHEIEYRTTTAKHDILGFRIKMLPYQYTTWHCGNQTIVRPSYFYNGIFYTGKMVSLYWNQPCIAYGRTWKLQNLDVITLRHIISIFYYVYDCAESDFRVCPAEYNQMKTGYANIHLCHHSWRTPLPNPDFSYLLSNRP